MYYPNRGRLTYPYPPPAMWQTPQQQEENRLKKTANAIGFAMMAVVVIMFSLQFIMLPILRAMNLMDYQNLYNGYSGIDPIAYYLMSGVISVTSMFIPFLVVIKATKTDVREIFPFERTKAGVLIACVCVGLAVCMYANFAADQWISNLRSVGIQQNYPDSPFDNNPISIALDVITVSLLPAFFEEFAFRGFILGSLRRHGDGFALIVSSFLFGIMHGNLVQIPFAFVVGLALGSVVLHTNCLWTAVLIHFFNNFYASMTGVVHNLWGYDAYILLSYACMLFFFLAGFIGFLYLLRKKEKFLTFQNKGILPFKRKIKAVASAPGLIVAFVLLGLETVIMLFAL